MNGLSFQPEKVEKEQQNMPPEEGMDLHRIDGNGHEVNGTLVGLVRTVKARAGEMTQLLKTRLTTKTKKGKAWGWQDGSVSKSLAANPGTRVVEGESQPF